MKARMPLRLLQEGWVLILLPLKVVSGGACVRPLVDFYMNLRGRREISGKKGLPETKGSLILRHVGFRQEQEGVALLGRTRCFVPWGGTRLTNWWRNLLFLQISFSVPAPDSHPGSPPANGMSFFSSQLRVDSQFPLPLFYCEVSRLFRVPSNQLVSNSFRILFAFFMIFQFNGVIPTASVFSQCFQLKRTESGIFHLAPRRGVSFLPTLNPPKRWKGSFFFVLPPRPWTISDRWIDDAPPALPFSLDDRSPNLCRLLQRLNESPYACKLMAKDRLLGHFGLSPRIEPLGKALDSIIFNKLLREEHHAATTPPSTRASRGASSFGDKRGKEGVAFSRATDILKSAATSSDRRLLYSVSHKDLDRILSLVLAKVVTLRGELLSHPVGESGEGQRRKLEEQVVRLQREATDLRAASKKEAVIKYQAGGKGS
ncbi:UNVERIFIED_CONTAM: hypothetical protein Scaly_2238500 [Sesamum calycinum]|uniref:Uncharacterized protein n=1 Tax=Sesamum calycinum TaxID=2727403 RepID=A0AAW2MAY4_9LAMI